MDPHEDIERHVVRDLEKTRRPRPVPETATLRERTDHLTWAWFTLPMSTGGLSLLLGAQPHTFTGLRTIGKVVFIFDLVIFLSLTSMISLRFLRDPSGVRRSLSNATESLFIPTLVISISTIITLIWDYGQGATGPWLATTVRVLFWIYFATSFLLANFQYWYLFNGVQFTIQGMTPAWLLPIFPFMLCGTIASSIASGQPDDQRFAICIAGATAQGLGFLVSLIFYSPYLRRMMQYGLPPPDLRPGMFIACGPPSFTSLALIGIADSLPSNYGYLSAHPGYTEVFQALALAMSIFIWSLAFWFFCIALNSVLAGIRRLTFHLVWWAFVFPNVGFTVAVITIAQALGSPAIGWVGTGMTLVLVVVYLFVLGMHTRAVIKGDILWPGKDEDKNE